LTDFLQHNLITNAVFYSDCSIVYLIVLVFIHTDNIVLMGHRSASKRRRDNYRRLSANFLCGLWSV